MSNNNSFAARNVRQESFRPEILEPVEYNLNQDLSLAKNPGESDDYIIPRHRFISELKASNAGYVVPNQNNPFELGMYLTHNTSSGSTSKNEF